MWGGTRAVLSLLLLVNAVVARDYVHQQDANYSSQPRSSSKVRLWSTSIRPRGLYLAELLPVVRI